MKSALSTNRFHKDVKRIEKRGADLKKLNTVVTFLQKDSPLPAGAHPHKLSGEYNGWWECYIESDWLLIYNVTDDAVIFVRTGTHADLFE